MASYTVIISREEKRGCGWRRAGKDGVGIYLVGPSATEACERLPFPLSVCPACGEGIRKSRAARWIDPTQLLRPEYEPRCNPNRPGHIHSLCPICNPRDIRGLLIWIGERHYRTTANFLEEAARMGVSRKLPNVPKGFEIGRHGVYLAHKRAVLQPNADPMPGLFSWFKPNGIDLVIDNGQIISDRAKRLKDELGDKARIVVVEKITESRREAVTI